MAEEPRPAFLRVQGSLGAAFGALGAGLARALVDEAERAGRLPGLAWLRQQLAAAGPDDETGGKEEEKPAD